MGNTRTKKKEFDPYLGGICAETWWDLGKLLANLDSDERLKKTVVKIHENSHPDYRSYVNVASLREFAMTAFDILRRFYEKESVKSDVEKLISFSSLPLWTIEEKSSEDGGLRFLEVIESEKAFWAIEYKALFEELCKPWKTEDDPQGWFNAVGRCEQCESFFVKQRKDQIFDTARCRTKFANRDAYLSRRPRRRGHG